MNKFAFDIGGTYIKSAVITEENQLLDYEKVKTPINENEAILNVVAQRLKQYIERYRTSKVLVGISTAGAVNRETASIAYANPNIKDYTGTQFGKRLASFVDDLRIYNDVDAAMLGELSFRNETYHSAFCLTLGTGIGGSYYHHDMGLLTGQRHRPNQIGHLLYDPVTQTNYEQRGSTQALKKQIQATYSECNVRQLFEDAQGGDVIARQYLQKWAYEIARGIAEIQVIYDPEIIIIGGGVSAQGEQLLQYIQPQITQFLPEGYGHARIEVAVLQNNAALIGAVSEL
ncbi:ROK family protein [Staphylococcus coagulans]|uniref:ROK family protein n=1 Tax=Staphylococcus coagulans TaxID=74706 RepID=UPI001F4C2018|nr:ROK family protein [Staphylococcus coagulans]UNB46697.1 ROK family protein [Staphylococcus coagulans]